MFDEKQNHEITTTNSDRQQWQSVNEEASRFSTQTDKTASKVVQSVESQGAVALAM